jgi:hypothetical protein
MFKHLKLIIACLVIGVIFTPALCVSAATTATVTITATGVVVGAPGGFTLTYISDYEVGIDWTPAAGSTNTLIRAATGRYPTSITDGWLVYFGAGSTTIDTGVSLDETATGIYYRAWAEKAGAYSPFWAEDFIEGGGMTFIAFAAIALGLTIGGFAIKRVSLVVGSAFGWLVLGGYSYSKITAPFESSIYFYLFLMCIAMVLAVAMEAVLVKRSMQDVLNEEQEIKRENKLQPDIVDESAIDRMRRKHGLPLSEARRNNIESRRARKAGF